MAIYGEYVLFTVNIDSGLTGQSVAIIWVKGKPPVLKSALRR